MLTDANLIGELTDSLGTARDALRQAEADAMAATRRAERAEGIIAETEAELPVYADPALGLAGNVAALVAMLDERQKGDA